MPIRIKYRPNHKDFGKLLMSDQTQDLADQAAKKGVQEATSMAVAEKLPAEYISSIEAATGPPRVLDGNPRRTAEVRAKYPYIEFGSGRKRKRPQGGNSPHYRILGRTLSKIGNPPKGGGGPS